MARRSSTGCPDLPLAPALARLLTQGRAVQGRRQARARDRLPAPRAPPRLVAHRTRSGVVVLLDRPATPVPFSPRLRPTPHVDPDAQPPGPARPPGPAARTAPAPPPAAGTPAPSGGSGHRREARGDLAAAHRPACAPRRTPGSPAGTARPPCPAPAAHPRPGTPRPTGSKIPPSSPGRLAQLSQRPARPRQRRLRPARPARECTSPSRSLVKRGQLVLRDGEALGGRPRARRRSHGSRHSCRPTSSMTENSPSR